MRTNINLDDQRERQGDVRQKVNIFVIRTGPQRGKSIEKGAESIGHSVKNMAEIGHQKIGN
jgi:hypothetical protein